ncbi:MAG TPA: hypothetical protein VMZ71_14720, partial [Gemmataceae bacterium]|nr:hypothetical protein [Gemmataceae bacterium]
MKKEMLINVLQPEECRIAIVENGVLEELYVERSSQESYVGNIYKGRIVNIEPSIQAAFVDFGIGRNGFLHVSDVDPAYYKHLLTKEQLADYEAELDREYTGGSGGGARTRDRGDRGPGRGDRGDRPRGDRPERKPREMTSFLEPQRPAPPADDEDAVEFASGLAEGDTTLEPVTPDVDAWTDDAPAAALPPPPPPPLAALQRPARKHVPAPPAIEDSDFGEGIVDERPATQPPPLPLNEDDIPMAEPVAELDEVPPPLPDSFDPIEVDPPAAETDSKVGRGRGSRRAKPKAEEEAPAPEATDDEAKKPRVRKPRKKADGDDDTPDAPPKFMGGAEHRTSPPDEPEIKPFFENDDFDINAPN